MTDVKVVHHSGSALAAIDEERDGVGDRIIAVDVSMRIFPFLPRHRRGLQPAVKRSNFSGSCENAPEVDQTPVDVVDDFGNTLVGKRAISPRLPGRGPAAPLRHQKTARRNADAAASSRTIFEAR